MKRFLCLALVLHLYGAAALAQFTTATGTVTDTNNVPYACGTISAQLVVPGGTAPTLNGVGFTTVSSPVQLGCAIIPGSGTAGTFTMRLADNNVVQPAGTQWKFIVNIANAPPPLGTGPQFCTSTVTVTGASQTIAGLSTCPALSNVVGASVGGINAQSGAYTAVAADSGKLITQSAVANVTLPNPAPSANWWVTVKNNSSSDIAVAPNGLTLDAFAGNSLLAPGSAMTVFSNGTNYFSGNAGAAINNPGGNLTGTVTRTWVVGVPQTLPGSMKFSGSAAQINSASGAIELVNGGTTNGAIGWRNNGSTGDILLVPNTSDILTYQVAAANAHPMRPIEQGSCAMAAGTTCTFTIGASFAATPITLASIDAASTPPATAISVKCSVSGTTVTVTAGASNSLTWDCALIGNPN